MSYVTNAVSRKKQIYEKVLQFSKYGIMLPHLLLFYCGHFQWKSSGLAVFSPFRYLRSAALHDAVEELHCPGILVRYGIARIMNNCSTR